jgi:hypothetical protein
MAMSVEERRERNAARMRRWRAENGDVHRAREKARYYKKKAEDPDALRMKSTQQMREWRKKYPDKAKAAARRFLQQNPASRRRTMIKRRYGMSLEDWDALFASQNGVCAICGGGSERGLVRRPRSHDWKSSWDTMPPMQHGYRPYAR